ncbi:MAG TPA: TlpA family protein disulfide reductase [Gammaproteobacteria bacterium]|nr:TlpA family protein disulfide reductase [Gammaproteobacteria bacterium]
MSVLSGSGRDDRFCHFGHSFLPCARMVFGEGREMMNRMRSLMGAALACVAIAANATGLRAVSPPQQAPALVLQDLGGQRHDLAELRGQVVLVNFWASWCRPCLAEMPSIQRLSERLRGRPFRVLAVDVGEGRATVWRFVRLLGLEFPVLLDEEGERARAWGVKVYPGSFLIDTSGRIRWRARGALEWDQAEVVRRVEELLAAEGRPQRLN